MGRLELTCRDENLQDRATKNQRKPGREIFVGIVTSLFIIYLLAESITGHIQIMVLYIYAGCSAMSFLAYCVDKHAARQGGRRVKESTLHWIDLLCGWPGACLAQRILRHKTTKEPFATIFLVTAMLNIVAFILVTSSAVFRAMVD